MRGKRKYTKRLPTVIPADLAVPPREAEMETEIRRLNRRVMDLENSRDRLERIISKLIED